MADYPYTTVTGKLKTFFDKIQDVGRPTKVNQQWLATIGLPSSNDRTIVSVARFIGFVDAASTPTSVWNEYRNKQKSRQVIGSAIQSAYADLFHTYPDAFQRSDQDLRNFFSTTTSAGAKAVALTVTTSKNLCALGDFGPSQKATDGVGSPAVGPPAIASIEQASIGVPAAGTRTNTAGLTINLNIQIVVPETKDEEVYDKFFAALKKNLLS